MTHFMCGNSLTFCYFRWQFYRGGLYSYAMFSGLILHKYVGITVLSFIRFCGNSFFYVSKLEWGSQVAPIPFGGEQLSVCRQTAIRPLADSHPYSQ